MAYNKRGYYLRARSIQQIAARHYEPGNQRKCLKSVWRRYIQPEYGLCYRSFLNYCKVELPSHLNTPSFEFKPAVLDQSCQS